MSGHAWQDARGPNGAPRRYCAGCGIAMMDPHDPVCPSPYFDRGLEAHPVEAEIDEAPAAAWHLVVVESPYAAAPMLPPGAGALDLAARLELHREYLAACLADALNRGEAPFASHGLYTTIGRFTVYNDNSPDQRAAGIAAGLAWGDLAARRAVYVDLGVSRGMLLGIARARSIGQPVELRRVVERHLGGVWASYAPGGCRCAADIDADGAIPCEACQARIDR